MPPYLLLALLLGAIYGTIFHIWQGQTLSDLLLYLISGLLGFGLGQLIGYVFGLNLFPIGSLHVAEATVISWLSLFAAKWLKLGTATIKREG